MYGDKRNQIENFEAYIGTLIVADFYKACGKATKSLLNTETNSSASMREKIFFASHMYEILMACHHGKW